MTDEEQVSVSIILGVSGDWYYSIHIKNDSMINMGYWSTEAEAREAAKVECARRGFIT